MVSSQIPQELVERIAAGNCVLFLGAETVVRTEAGQVRPSWRGITSVLAQRCGYSELDMSLAKVAQYFEMTQGRHALITVIAEVMADPAYVPGPVHELIAQLLFNIRYIERWNTGVERMRRQMREHGLSEPVFEEIGQTFRVTFYGPGEDILDLIPEEGVTDLRELGLNERQVEALRLMVNEREEMTNRLYREMFDVTARTALRDLKDLVEAGQARQVGQGRNIRYVAG